MALDQHDDGLKLFAIGHASREAVEVFDVITDTNADPTLVWRGCVLAPAGAQLNSVTAVPGGGFAVTKFFDQNEKNRADH